MAMIESFETDLATGMVRIEAGGLRVFAQSVQADAEPALCAAVMAARTLGSSGLHAWDGLALVPVQERPSPRHTWDWLNMAWSITLAEAQEAKLQAIGAWRDAKEYAPFTWQGLVFDATPDALRRLSVAATVARDAMAAGADRTVTWTLADNTSVDLSAANILAVMRAYGDAMDTAHATARALKAAVRSAATLVELDAIAVPSN